WAGMVTFSGALFALVFALIRGNEEGWDSALIVGLLVGAVLLLIAFIVIEHRTGQPMLDLNVFRKPAFDGASIVAVTVAASAFSMFFYETLYMQDVLHLSPLETGVRFLPGTVLSFFVA